MKNKGFTLIELLVVISIIGILSSVVLESLNDARAKARDTQRLSDMHQLQIALDLYFNQYGVYPTHASDAGANYCGGWDATYDGTFVPSLISSGFFPSAPKDSTDSLCGNYSYYRYPAGSYGCDPSRGAFYLLGIRNMEKSGNPHPASPGWSCPSRNWQGEFEYVTGKFES